MTDNNTDTTRKGETLTVGAYFADAKVHVATFCALDEATLLELLDQDDRDARGQTGRFYCIGTCLCAMREAQAHGTIAAWLARVCLQVGREPGTLRGYMRLARWVDNHPDVELPVVSHRELLAWIARQRPGTSTKRKAKRKRAFAKNKDLQAAAEELLCAITAGPDPEVGLRELAAMVQARLAALASRGTSTVHLDVAPAPQRGAVPPQSGDVDDATDDVEVTVADSDVLNVAAKLPEEAATSGAGDSCQVDDTHGPEQPDFMDVAFPAEVEKRNYPVPRSGQTVRAGRISTDEHERIEKAVAMATGLTQVVQRLHDAGFRCGDIGRVWHAVGVQMGGHPGSMYEAEQSMRALEKRARSAAAATNTVVAPM